MFIHLFLLFFYLYDFVNLARAFGPLNFFGSTRLESSTSSDLSCESIASLIFKSESCACSRAFATAVRAACAWPIGPPPFVITVISKLFASSKNSSGSVRIAFTIGSVSVFTKLLFKV